MKNRADDERCVKELMTKLDANRQLDVDDVKFALTYLRLHRDGDELEGYKQEIDETITEALGHEVYTSIIREFKKAGVVDDLRCDLIDPSLDPDGFKKVDLGDRIHYRPITVGDRASEYVGFIHSPEKRPGSLSRISKSLLDYLFCTGKGFHLDAEMIYDYETDYRELLCAVIERTDCLDRYNLDVTCNGDEDSTICIELYVDNQSYEIEFEQAGDWLRFEAFEPVQAALNAESTTKIYGRGGNDGWLLVSGEENYELLASYLYYTAEFPR